MNIAFVGCGFVFDLYMRTILAHPTLLIQGLFDTDADRLAKVSQFYNIPKYASYDELLKDDDVDLVVNLTNIESHFEVSKRALEEGKHVYSEKPLTKDLAQTKELFVLAEEHGVELPDMKKGTLQRRVDDQTLPSAVRELLSMRLEASTTSTTKYNAMIKAVSPDGRVRGAKRRDVCFVVSSCG